MKKIIYLFVFLQFLLVSCDDSSSGKKYPVPDVDIRLPPVTCGDIDPSSGFHVTVNGTPEGDGSLENPWDLNTALRNPAAVKPGDTIWIHEGTYKGTWVAKLDGEEGAPIIISAYPGERVTLDNEGDDKPVLQIYHKWAIFRNLELTNSDPDRRSARATGIWAGGDHISLQNLIVHDVGVGISGGQLDNDVQQGNFIELHGCLFYNNGWLGDDRGHGHHIYLTNRDSRMMLSDNLIFSAYGSGVHVYSDTDRNYVQGFDFIGNVWFLNGAPGKKLVDGCLVGHNGTLGVDEIYLSENYGWATINGRDVRMGWSSPHNGKAVLKDNYIVGKTIFMDDWDEVTLENNTIIGDLEGLSYDDYPDNTYLSELPTENKIIVRPNRYQPGRANIIVYNWEDSDFVAVNLENVMPSGTSYILRNAQDYYGEPVLSGVYEGGDLLLPMNDLHEEPPFGETDEIPEKTGKAFNVFVLEADVCGFLR